MKLSVAVMTHPSRADRLQKLMEDIRSMSHPDFDYDVVVDINSLGIWETAKKAWKAYAPDATHHMVLQDDIILSQDFFTVSKKLIGYVSKFDPTASLSFCDNLEREMQAAKRNGLHWVVTTKCRHAQCLVQPTNQINHWIDWCEWYIRPEYYHDDGRLEIYLFKHNRRIWHAVPSLVEHDDHGSVQSGMGLRFNEENAYKSFEFIGEGETPDMNAWGRTQLQYASFVPAHLNIPERWACGDLEYINPIDHVTHPILGQPSSGNHYTPVMEKTRIERGAVQPPDTGDLEHKPYQGMKRTG